MRIISQKRRFQSRLHWNNSRHFRGFSWWDGNYIMLSILKNWLIKRKRLRQMPSKQKIKQNKCLEIHKSLLLNFHPN